MIMENGKPYLAGLILATLLSFTAMPMAWAEKPELCAPFKNDNVDQSVVTMLITAAETGGLYRIEPNASNLEFGVESIIGRIEAEFTDFQGGISLIEEAHVDQGPALVRIGTTSLSANGPIIKQLLKGDSFFNVDEYPEVYFVSRQLTWTGINEGILEGELTLRGITQPVSFRIDLSSAEMDSDDHPSDITLVATTTIQRSDFGMSAYPKLAENSVDLSIRVNASRVDF